MTTVVAQQDTAQTPAAAAPAEAPTGRVHLVLFGARHEPLAGLEVALRGGSSGVTDENGAAQLQAPPGETVLTVRRPGAGTEPPPALERPLQVYARETVQVLLTLGPDGALLDEDIEAPASAAATPLEPGLPQAPPGHVVGRVQAEETGTPVLGAKVFVLGSDAEAQTDENGEFRIQVPSGVHTLSVIHPRFSTHVERDVNVAPEAETRLLLNLVPAAIELDEFVVKVPRVEGSVARVFEARRNSAAVTDALGAEDLARSPDGSASAATRRIVGATIVDGKFLFVRGLGGRYTNVRLNGVPLPSTDPDVPGVQLDLFPANLLNDLTIAKTFTANIPGDFAGGSMNIATRAFPDEFTVNTSVGTNFNTEAVFQDMYSYPGGKLDWLGTDDGTRQLPDAVPEERLVRPSRTMPGVPRDEINEIAKSFPPIWETEEVMGLPDIKLSGSVGNTFDVGGRPLGVMLSLNYKHEMRSAEKELGKVRIEGEGDDAEVVLKEQLDEDAGQIEANLGALANVGFELATGHELRWASFFTQVGTDYAAHTTGFSEEEGREIDWTRLNYVSRHLFFNQFLGQHRDFLGELEFDWQFNFDVAGRDQPDSRSLLYQQLDMGWAWVPRTGSGERLYTDLAQKDFGGGLDLRHPLWEGQLGAGYMTRHGNRTFLARRFGHAAAGSQADRYLDPNELFAPENQGVTVELNEVTADNDGYVSGDHLHAGYLAYDTPWNDWLRSHVGVRLEAFSQSVRVENPYSGEPPGEDFVRDDLDALPSAALNFALSDAMAIRTAYGGTVGRPLARELAPFRTQDYTRRRTVQGNPDLQRTYIHNVDARFEVFPSTTEVLAASAYYKAFRAPIETIIQDSQGNITFENAEDATNFGLELEARVSLGHLAPVLEDVTAMWNLSLTYSRVTLTDAQAEKATEQERPLAGQSPWVVNFSLGYEPRKSPFRAFAYYNVFGPRIVEVGTLGLPDVVEQPFHSVDLSAFYDFDEHWTLNVTAKNLAFQSVRITQDQFIFEKYALGAEFGAKITFRN